MHYLKMVHLFIFTEGRLTLADGVEWYLYLNGICNMKIRSDTLSDFITFFFVNTVPSHLCHNNNLWIVLIENLTNVRKVNYFKINRSDNIIYFLCNLSKIYSHVLNN